MDSEATAEQINAARSYESLFVPTLFGPYSRRLIQHAELAPEQSVLDVACGTGALTREVIAAVGNKSRVHALDPLPGMLAVAKAQCPSAEFSQGTAESLPYGDDAFDQILCQFGMMFFEDPVRAAAEFRRVLKPGAKVLLSVWSTLDQNPFYADLATALDAELGSAAGDALRQPFHLGDSPIPERALRQAGFQSVREDRLELLANFPSLRQLVEADMHGWLPLVGIEPTAAQVDAVIATVAQTQNHEDGADAPIAISTSARLLSAAAP